MQDDRTISVNADDLLQLAYFAAQGILDESEDDSMDNLEHEGEARAELGQILARAFGYSNMARTPWGSTSFRTRRPRSWKPCRAR
jgi:hypothetical protein